MPHYILYFFDQAQRPTDFVEFEQPDDSSAIETLEAQRKGRAAELWRGNSRILWWPADKNET
ncbi:MAG TPA: hypothetical protein VGH03_22755 [Caulobacteraceae bacterium]